MKLVALVLGFVLPCTSVVAQPDTLILLHLNDTHSNLAPIGPRDANLKGTLGGIARAASVLMQDRLAGKNVLTLHAGDVFVGDMFFNQYFGVPEFKILELLGLDAMAIGNHEFDLMPSTLQQALDSANVGYPFLSANINLSDPLVSGLKKYIKPFTVKQIGNIKVGVFGVTTPATMLLSQPSPAVVDSDFVMAAAAMVDTLTKQGCQLIVCLSHLGVGLDQLLASYVPGIHLIVGGHDHYRIDQPMPVANPAGNTTYILQANAFYLDIGRMTLAVSTGKVKIVDYQMIPLDQSIPEDATIKNEVDQLIAGIEAVYGRVFSQRIGYAAEEFGEVVTNLTSVGYKDSPVGALITTAYREVFKTDIALQVGGSTAQPIYKGPIVADDLFRVVGYGFTMHNGLGYRMATFSVSGSDLWKGIEFCLSTIEENDEFLPQVAGMKYRYNACLPQGQRLQEITVGGQPVDPARMYSVAANEFVPVFLSGFLGLTVADLRTYDDSTEAQVLWSYVTQQDTIRPQQPNNITSPVVEAKKSLPSAFELKQNYPNPFNPTTVIGYELPVISYVSLKLYDILGREVATLVNEERSAGTYTVPFDASRLSSGIYFYSLRVRSKEGGQAGSFVQTKKMLLAK